MQRAFQKIGMRNKFACSLTVSVLTVLTLAVSASGKSAAWPHEVWYVWTAITDPSITTPTAGDNYAPVNGEVAFTCSTCSDTDKHVVGGNTYYPSDTVTYTWSAPGGGTFPYGNTGTAVTWKAPASPGTYTVTVTVDDVNGHPPPGTGSDNDTSKQASRDMNVFQADLDISGVTEANEENPGGFVPLNDDDDNHNDTADNGEGAAVTGENNLVAITLDVLPHTLPGTDTATITWTNDAKIDVFEGNDRSTPVSSGASYQLSAMPKTLYVEGDQTSADTLRDIEVKLEYTKAGQTSEDKVKLTVVTVYNVDATPTTDGKNVGAASAADADETKFHVVTSMKADTDLTVVASVTPNVDEVKNKVTWEGATQDPTDKMKATKSRGASGRFPVSIKVDGNTCEEGYVWVGWATMSATQTGALRYFHADATCSGHKVDNPPWDFAATITPATIISDNERPDLANAKTVDPPGGTNACGAALSGGANKKWDISRPVRKRVVTKPAGWTDADWCAQPCLYNDVPNYPANNVEGNDDASTLDEDNDPYAAPDIGKLTSQDDPGRSAKNASGAVDDTLEIRIQFGDFARLQIGDTWHRISDFFDWRFHWLVKKADEAADNQDYNNDGDKLDQLWINNGSVTDATNNGW